MLLKCELVVLNRAALGMESRKCHSTFLLGKEKKKEKHEVFFTVYSTKTKIGTKYKVHDNILKVHNRFAKEGKCTLSMKNPPHDLAISKADVNALKKFLHVLKLVFNKEDIDKVTELENVLKVKNCDIEKPKVKMQILSRNDYPLKSGFASTLQTLAINGCLLQRLDTRILKLQSLTILDLSKNKLKTLPESLDGLKSLRCLNLSDNDFDCFPDSILRGECAARIHMLEMNSNRISYLPSNIIRLKNLHTLKMKDNHLVSIPHSFGNMKSLQRLELNNNLLQCLPWSFSILKFDFLDVSGNAFGEMNVGILDEKYRFELPVPSTLFEICCRKIVQRDSKCKDLQRLPTLLKDILRSSKYCPCGTPCVNEGIPYVFSCDLSRLTHTMSYSMGKDDLKMLSHLCSMNCYQSYCKNPIIFQRRGLSK